MSDELTDLLQIARVIEDRATAPASLGAASVPVRRAVLLDAVLALRRSYSTINAPAEESTDDESVALRELCEWLWYTLKDTEDPPEMPDQFRSVGRWLWYSEFEQGVPT